MSTPEPEKSSRTLFLIIFAVILISFAAFLIVRPNPSAGSSGSSTSSPAAPKK